MTHPSATVSLRSIEFALACECDLATRNDSARRQLGKDAVNNLEGWVTAILARVARFLASIPTVKADVRLLARGQVLTGLCSLRKSFPIGLETSPDRSSTI
jgi:hypothetical protein